AVGDNLAKVEWATDGKGTPATGTGPTFTTKFNQAGVYTVTASCGKSSASATFTAVSIAFSNNPIKTGRTGSVPQNPCGIKDFVILTKVVVAVPPASAVVNVTVSVSTGGQSSATIVSQQVSTEAGTIAVTLKGTEETPKEEPDGDIYLQANVAGAVCKQVPIIVLAPYSVVPRSDGPTKVQGVNLASNACTVPAYSGPLPQGWVHLWTSYGIQQKISVLDQFEKPLDAMYNGAPVFERGAFTPWIPINVTVSGGSYSDDVGSTVDRPDGADFPADSATAKGWPAQPALPAVALDNVANNPEVMIAGFRLPTGVIDRRVTVAPIPGTTSANITITWSQ
ncbi:MAG TPA: hypothetical protein PK867_22235, partial [Pirellulales bacterium]|nr:hypothetical protein [Pirellulales bacterium]